MLTDIEQVDTIITYGIYFGYSRESILEFLHDFNKCKDPNTDEWSNNRFKTRNIFKNGHIISTSEIDIPIEILIDNINKRRYCTFDFLSSANLKISDCENEVNELLSNNEQFNADINDLKDEVHKVLNNILI